MDDAPAVDTMLTENAQELVDSRTVLLKNQDTRYRLCQLLAKHTERWTWIVLREKAVYHTLNMFKADVSGMLRGEGWVVAECFDEVRDTVNRSHSNMDLSMPVLSITFPSRGQLLPRTLSPTSLRTDTRSLSTRTVFRVIERPTLPSLRQLPSLSSLVSCTEISVMVFSCSLLVVTFSGTKRPTTMPSSERWVTVFTLVDT